MAVFLCSIFSAENLSAQRKTKPTTIIELTETDFAKLKDFDARYATVFGVGLDMNVGKVQTIIKAKPYLKLEKDAFNRSRYYLYDISHDTGKVLLGYLKWHPKDSGLQEFILYPEITPYLKGLSGSILTKECQDPQSDIYKNFLGAAVDKDIILDIPSIPLKTTRYYYPALSLIIESQLNEKGTKYNLILFDF
ncbi:MAG: hypothetical protein EOP53_19850 [Sphingobacteriales bacterium]|nr:MAG: hypothetical protein EOP53_19850 [Sphingobacteriales bacterium]